MPKKLERKIYCFKIYNRSDVETITIIERLNKLSWDEDEPIIGTPSTTSTSRFADYDDEKKICGWFNFRIDGSIRIRLAYSRYGGLPMQQKGGRLIPLPLAGQLAESTHMIWYPEDNYLITEFNNSGPRPTSFLNYIYEKLKIGDIHISPIMSAEVLQELEQFSRIGFARFATTVKHLEYCKNESNNESEAQKQPLLATIHTSKVLGEEVILDFSFKLERGVKDEAFLDNIKQLFRWFFKKNERLVGVTSLQVKGNKGDQPVELLNLLQDKIVFIKKVVTETDKTRSVKTSDMYNKITEVFNELKGKKT